MMLDTATDLGPDSILKYGQKTNLDMTAFSACLKEKKVHLRHSERHGGRGRSRHQRHPQLCHRQDRQDRNRWSSNRQCGSVFAVFDSTIKDKLASK